MKYLNIIFHITSKLEWHTAQKSGTYHAKSLASEGFIHCSTKNQIIKTANLFYARRTDLIILCIDAVNLQSEIKYEAASGYNSNPRVGALFPHIYGPITIAEVIKVVNFPSGNGRFYLPNTIKSMS